MSREQLVRKELAAAFRWAERLNFHEAVANHFSMAVTDDGQQFVVNRAGMHFSQATASGLVTVDTAMKKFVAVRRRPHCVDSAFVLASQCSACKVCTAHTHALHHSPCMLKGF